MSRKMLAALAMAATAACGKGERRDVAAADSLNRDLQLAPVDSSAKLNDRPAATPTPARTPRRSTPRPSSGTASSGSGSTSGSGSSSGPSSTATGRSLAAGTAISLATSQEIRSNTNKVGDEVQARVEKDVMDARGRTVIPAGSTVTLAVTAIHESENKSDNAGTLTLAARSVSINGSSYPLSASIDHLDTHLESHGTNAGDVAKVGAGAGIGAIVGRVLGGSTKGAVIGGVIGGAVGAQRAVETKDRYVVLPVGTTVSLSLTDTFSPAR